MFVPPAKSVVDQISFMLPAMSSVPWVDRDLFFVFDKTSLMPASWDVAADLSRDIDWVYSPAVADVMAWTSAAVLSMTAIFRLWKSDNWSDALDRARSRDWISDNFDEHMQRRYASFAVPQNWSMHVKYASRHVL